jgi:hypothetical protein
MSKFTKLTAFKSCLKDPSLLSTEEDEEAD